MVRLELLLRRPLVKRFPPVLVAVRMVNLPLRGLVPAQAVRGFRRRLESAAGARHDGREGARGRDWRERVSRVGGTCAPEGRMAVVAVDFVGSHLDETRGRERIRRWIADPDGAKKRRVVEEWIGELMISLCNY